MELRLVIVETDPAAREVLRAALESEKLPVAWEVSGDAAAARKKNENAVVLWCGPKDRAPGDIRIRENDYFAKPMRLGALLDRVRFHAQAAHAGGMPDTIRFGDYVLDLASGEWSDPESGVKTRLTDKEKRVLMLLHAAQGKLVERQVLLDKVWGYADTLETHTLETHIYRLRRKIERDPARPEILLTDEAGYRLGL